MKLSKALLLVIFTCFLASCGEIKLVTIREKGKKIQQYQVIRKTKVQHGFERFYHANGQIDGEVHYENGVYHGVFKYFYKDGTLKQEGEFVDGKMEGLLKTYYNNGILKEEIAHKNGQTQGSFKEYNEKGIMSAEGAYTYEGELECLEEGLLKLYDESGVLKRKMICRTGQCCTIWTKTEGDVEPTSPLCEAIIKAQKDLLIIDKP